MARRSGSAREYGVLIVLVLLLALVVGLIPAVLAVTLRVLPLVLALVVVSATVWLGTRALVSYRSPASRLQRQEASLARRMARLVNRGEFGQVVHLCAGSKDGERWLVAALDTRLGRAATWPVGAAVREVARELLVLERSRVAALTAALPAQLTDHLAEAARETADGLWDEAGRLAAVAVGGEADLPRLSARLRQREQELLQVRERIRETREDLAELTLSGIGALAPDELASAAERLRAATAGWRWLSAEANQDRSAIGPAG